MNAETTDVVIPEWELDEALMRCRELNRLLKSTGYYIALAGGVLNNGLSHKDLDLVLYPGNDITHNYAPALEVIRSFFNATIYCFVFKEPNHKLVFELTTPDRRRVDVMIPNMTNATRTERISDKFTNDYQ